MTTVFLLNGTTSYTLPGDWSVSSNKIEAVGSGWGDAGFSFTGGGGGGAYAAITNLSDTAGTVETVQIGAANSTTVTQFKNSSTLKADYGRALIGGAVVNSVGTVKYAGGNGGANSGAGGGGGGAAGPNGAGGNGGSGFGSGTGGGGGGGGANGGSAGATPVSSTGGTGGNNFGGTGGGAAQTAGTLGGGGGGGNNGGTGGNASSDQYWDATHGLGSGVGGIGQSGGNSGVTAGYGGGGAYAQGGGPGIIVITYTPSSTAYNDPLLFGMTF